MEIKSIDDYMSSQFMENYNINISQLYILENVIPCIKNKNEVCVLNKGTLIRINKLINCDYYMKSNVNEIGLTYYTIENAKSYNPMLEITVLSDTNDDYNLYVYPDALLNTKSIHCNDIKTKYVSNKIYKLTNKLSTIKTKSFCYNKIDDILKIFLKVDFIVWSILIIIWSLMLAGSDGVRTLAESRKVVLIMYSLAISTVLLFVSLIREPILDTIDTIYDNINSKKKKKLINKIKCYCDRLMYYKAN